MTGQTVQAIRFGASWSTQFRFTQAIGRGLSDLTPIRATVVIGQSGVAQLESRELDLVFSKSVTNEHLFTGKGALRKGRTRRVAAHDSMVAPGGPLPLRRSAVDGHRVLRGHRNEEAAAQDGRRRRGPRS